MVKFSPQQGKVKEGASSVPHIQAGYIKISPQAAFRTHRDALQCFGYHKGHYQRSLWKIPEEVCEAIGLPWHSAVWFPQFSDHEEWENLLSDEGTLIIEKKKRADPARKNQWSQRIVMAKVPSVGKGDIYRFIGVFEIIPEFSHGNEHRFRRVSTEVRTFSPTE